MRTRGILYTLVAGVALAGAGVAWQWHLEASHALPQDSLAVLGAAFDGFEAPAAPAPFYFIEIIDSCGIHYEGTCAVAREAPATSSLVALRLRTGVVLEVASTTIQSDGHTWYKVVFSDALRYPERVGSDWYVAADNTRLFTDSGDEALSSPDADEAAEAASTTKHIVIHRVSQTLSAYDGDTLVFESPVSTGLDLTPTPRGTFEVYKKTPSRYMQGPLPGISDQYYDLPGVPWDLYFTAEGGAIHGAYWHNSFGQEWSHGCVNLPLDVAQMLYYWAPLGTPVVVED